MFLIFLAFYEHRMDELTGDGETMATALLSQPPSSSSIFRKQSKSYPNRKLWKCSEKFIPKCYNSSIPTLGNGFGMLKSMENTQFGSLGKRELILFGLSSSVSMILPSSDVFAAATVAKDKELKMELLVDEINAYSFLYPLEAPGKKKFVFKWVVSRKPERYSSAAPLSPDARQRIVSERVDIIDNVIISVSIGPPNPQFLKSEKSTWEAKDVADAVLSDKSALRVTSAQRKAESSVLETHSSIIDGEPYWYYEYLVRKSPTNSAPDRNLFRHYISSTAERDGYLYSLNASTLSKQWDFMGPILEKTVASFRLLPPTDNYVPPFKDPWRIW